MAAKMKEEDRKEFWLKMNSHLIGKKIVDVFYENAQNCEELAWEESPLCIMLDDKSVLVPMRDEEGNGAGCWFTSHPRISRLPEIYVNFLGTEVESDLITKIKKLLVGKKIKELDYMTQDECEGMGWCYSSPILILNDGLNITVSEDVEGNGAGCFITGQKTDDDIFPALAVEDV